MRRFKIFHYDVRDAFLSGFDAQEPVAPVLDPSRGISIKIFLDAWTS